MKCIKIWSITLLGVWKKPTRTGYDKLEKVSTIINEVDARADIVVVVKPLPFGLFLANTFTSIRA